jgi:group II intron reverse transcriptase/maturase
VTAAKSYWIAKHEVVRAYKRVRANGGAAGADGVSLEQFERDVKNNLYRIWNQMSSGSYFAAPVKRVEIPKSDGKTRPLGIPTVADRVAQMVVKQRLEPLVEPLFHADSYGYRPGRSAHDAVRKARRRCWQYGWVLDLDIKGFFDNLDWGLLMKAVRKHAKLSWVELYIQRWLQAEVVMPDGTVQRRERGTPQGGVISPLLANLFLHYAFDEWMKRHHPGVPFERYADDIICHCKSRAQAEELREQLDRRLGECGLQLHPEKTKLVQCGDGNRAPGQTHVKFDFLGFTFKRRSAKGPRGVFTTFSPAVSAKALKAMRERVRGWRLGSRVSQSLEQLQQEIGPMVQGWVNYYGVFRASTLYRAMRVIDEHLVKWAQHKYKRMARRQHRAWEWLQGLQLRMPRLFPHWWAAIRRDWTMGAV